MNLTGVVSLDKVAADKRVLKIERESGTTSDARYVYTMTLIRGWQVDDCHYPCENTARDLRNAFARLKPCFCEECK